MELQAGHEVTATRDIRRGYDGGRYVMFGSRGVITAVNRGRHTTYQVAFISPGFFGERQGTVSVHDVVRDEMRRLLRRLIRP